MKQTRQPRQVRDQTDPETETDTDLKDGDKNTDIYSEEINQAIQALKENNKAKNKKIETKKRLIVGFFVLSMTILSIQLGTLYMQFLPLAFAFFCFMELHSLRRNAAKDQQSHIEVLEWMLLVFNLIVSLPKSIMKRDIMENSGFSAEKNPLLFGFLYDYMFVFITVGGTLIFLAFVLNLKEGQVKYQVTQFSFSFMIAIFAMMVGPMLCFCSHFGRYWYFFPLFAVSWNDSFAYFCGRAFGRTKLINLSPRKTLEGFIGAMFATVFVTFVCLDYWLQGSNFWTCAPQRFTVKPFENYVCPEQHHAYIVTEYQLPFRVLGQSSIGISPAVIYSCIICLFASLIAPFAGFFASGLKRANKIKDFGTTLPGHGGFTDRLDCIMFMVIFVYMIISQLIFRDEVRAENAFRQVQSLDDYENRVEIFNLLAAKFDQPALAFE